MWEREEEGIIKIIKGRFLSYRISVFCHWRFHLLHSLSRSWLSWELILLTYNRLVDKKSESVFAFFVIITSPFFLTS